jgi:hypothetical protein
MPGTYLTSFTMGPAEPFGGASKTNYTTHLILPHLIEVGFGTYEATGQFVRIGVLDHGTRGGVCLLTAVKVTGEWEMDFPPVVLNRLACFDMISNLNETSLLEATEALSKIYNWQLDQDEGVHEEKETRMLPALGHQMIESRHLVLND